MFNAFIIKEILRKSYMTAVCRRDGTAVCSLGNHHKSGVGEAVDCGDVRNEGIWGNQ